VAKYRLGQVRLCFLELLNECEAKCFDLPDEVKYYYPSDIISFQDNSSIAGNQWIPKGRRIHSGKEELTIDEQINKENKKLKKYDRKKEGKCAQNYKAAIKLRKKKKGCKLAGVTSRRCLADK